MSRDILIVGAGPTGLVLALWLTRLGVRVRIIDKTAEPGTASRALAVQARSLEHYAQVGLADIIVSRGRKILAVNLWAAGRHAARAEFAGMGEGISPFPYALIYPQDEHEQLLVDSLAALGIKVERQTELLGFEEVDGHVTARIRLPNGVTDICHAEYIAGCDGAHSTVRDVCGVGFAGGIYAHLFYVADVEADGPAINGEIHAALDETDFLAVFPLAHPGRARLVGTVRDEAVVRGANLTWQDVSQRVIEWMRIDVARVNWFSTYRVHHRVADRFSAGRAFLVGDAAHIHSPVGGQGMNTGIGDAVNLAWKLAAVVKGEAQPALLSTYETERMAFARRLVATTDRAFTAVTSDSLTARIVRLQVVPRVLPLVFQFDAARRFLFRTISQTSINYRNSPLSEGQAGAVSGGDRLPWVKVQRGQGDDGDNFAPLTSLAWQAHVYGTPTPELMAACEAQRVPLHVFPWRTEAGQAGLQQGAVYLVRPDGYVALADPVGRAEAIASYFDARRELLQFSTGRSTD